MSVWNTAQFYGNRPRASAWGWYPDLGMFTYLPGRGRVYNPFGWYFFSPVAMWQIYYAPVQTYNPGYSTASNSGGSYDSRSASSTPQAPASVAASTGDIGRAAPSAPAQATGPRSR